LDQYERCLNRLYDGVIENSKEPISVLTAIEQGGSGVGEIRKQFQVSGDLQQLRLEKNEAWKIFDESVPREGQITQRIEDLRKLDKMLDAAVDQISTGLPINIGIGGAFAFERDPSGRKIDQFLKSLFDVDFAKKRVAMRGDEDPIGSARHIGRRVAFQFCSRDVFDRVETLRGKGPAYFAAMLRKEQSRSIRDEEIEDRNHLGGTPKESRGLSKDDRELIRAANQTATENDDFTAAVALSSPATPEEIALAQEEERLT